ncbi:MAG TPA: hypothetical protein VII06_09725 [Chloroflexota bacterium]|jgi:hypothetical protein
MTEERSPRPTSNLTDLYQTHVSVEKLRIQIGNRVSAIARGADEVDPDMRQLYERLHQAAQSWEAEIESLYARQLRRWLVWQDWLQHVKGIGPQLALPLLALLLPPLEDRGPSTWYKAAGLTTEERPDGTRRLPRARAGEGKITYHPGLRRQLFLVAESFVRTGGYYREVYERQYDRLFHLHAWAAADFLDGWRSTGVPARADWVRHQYEQAAVVAAWMPLLTTATKPGLPAERFRADPLDDVAQDVLSLALASPAINKSFYLVGASDETWPLLRIERVARWATVKLFMLHLWNAWLASEGKTARPSYPVEFLGHHVQEPPAWDGKGKI